MPTFGQHDTGQRLHLSGVGALYILKSDPQKILKVVQPPVGIWSDEQMNAEITAFLSRAKVQKTVARASENWAPIHESAAIKEGTEGSSGGGAATLVETAGSSASGAYVVMDRYERSVHSLIDGRVNLHNEDLRNLMTGILKGLRDIRKISNRAHGNLKTNNILLANSANLGQAKVHLTDPASETGITPASDKKDFTDLAKILYEVVNLRPYQGGTIPKTKDWSELGPNGEDWRKLCNTLIEVGSGGGTADDRDFDKMISTIDTWRAKPSRSKIPLIAAAVLVLLVVGGVATWWFTREKALDFNQANWEKLCLEYHSWFENFATMDDSTKKKFSAAPYPVEAIKLLDGAGKDLERFKPQSIAKRSVAPLKLAADPTDDAKTGYGPNYTLHGLELIDKVSNALTPEHWELLNSLNKTATVYDARGWKRPAAGIRALIEFAKPPVVPTTPADLETRSKDVKQVDMLANIENTIKASNSVIEIDKRWASIQDLIKNLPAGDVPLLKAFPKFAEDFARSDTGDAANSAPGTLADVQDLSRSFTQIETVVNQLSADLNRKDLPINFAEFAKDPAAQLPADGKITPDMYTELLKFSKDYVILKTDPRAAVAWKDSLDEIQKDFIDPIKEANPQDPNLAGMIKRKADIVDTVATFTKMAPIAKNFTRLRALTGFATDDLDKLRTDGQTWVAPYIIDPAKYLTDQHARLNTSLLSKGNPIVYAQWQKAQTALLAKVEADPKQLKQFRSFQAIDAKFAALQSIYADFNVKMIPEQVPGLSDFPSTPAWKAIIAKRVATVYRDQALTDLMTNPALKWADDLPQVADPAYQSFAKNRIVSYDQIRQDTLALMDDFSTIQSRLDNLELRPGEPTKDAKSWRDLLARWKDSKSPLLADSEIAANLKPITDRTAALLAIDGVTDYKTLVAASLSTAPEIALTGWRKVGDAPINESLPVLDDEEKSEAHLTTLLKHVERAAPISAEIKSQQPVRWHRYAALLTTPAAIQNALDRRQTFAVSLSAQSDPNLVFDATLYDLRKEFDKNPKEAELKEIARKFMANVAAMPPAISKDKTILDILARMEKAINPPAGAAAIGGAGAGPKLAGWEQETPPNNPDVRIFYFPNKANAKHTLEFTRIQAGQKTVFLCTTDVSFGLFAEVANLHVNDLDNTGKPAAQAHWFKPTGDPWDGPRVWQFAGKFTANSDWVFVSPQLGNNSPYPANAAPEKPSGGYPMQQITPWSAMYIARALGCRLPTSEEWKTAYDKFEANGQKDVWNLRGAGFLTQHQYSAKLAASGAQWPDTGIFLSADQLFAGITADAAKPWTSDNLAKLAPSRISGGGSPYATSQIWFRKVAAQPGVKPPGEGTGIPHDLVGNVAQYVFDAPNANAVVKDAAANVADIDAAVKAGAKNLSVIGGSSLSPPQTPFNVPQPVDPDFAQTSTGFSDVGFRLAYTAPIDSIADVLSAVFRAPPYLPGAGAK